MPQDALRGTLKRLCLSPSAIKQKIDEIESASPVTIFEDEDGEDE